MYLLRKTRQKRSELVSYKQTSRNPKVILSKNWIEIPPGRSFLGKAEATKDSLEEEEEETHAREFGKERAWGHVDYVGDSRTFSFMEPRLHGLIGKQDARPAKKTGTGATKLTFLNFSCMFAAISIGFLVLKTNIAMRYL